MEYRPEEIKVGAFVVISFLILLVFVVAISGIEFGKEEKIYTADFSYTGGIDEGAQVRLGGYLVGRVIEVRLPTADQPRIEFVLAVEESAPVRTNSEAFVTSIGLMGEYYVEITTGTPDAPLLPPGSRIRSKDVPSWSQMGEPMKEVSDNLNELLVRVSDVLREENRDRIASMLASMETMLNENQTQLRTLMENLNRLTSHVASIGQQADSLMVQNSALVHSTLERLDLAIQEAEVLLETVQSASENIDGLLSNHQENLSQILVNLENATRHFEDFSRGIKERPWNLVRKSAPKKRELP